MPNMNERVEELARELAKNCALDNQDMWHEIPEMSDDYVDCKKGWRKLAKHVLKREIDKEYRAFNFSLYNTEAKIRERMNELIKMKVDLGN